MTTIVSITPIHIQTVKCDPLKETPRKAEGYTDQDELHRLSKLEANFKATYSLSQIFDCHDQHA